MKDRGSGSGLDVYKCKPKRKTLWLGDESVTYRSDDLMFDQKLEARFVWLKTKKCRVTGQRIGFSNLNNVNLCCSRNRSKFKVRKIVRTKKCLVLTWICVNGYSYIM